MSTNFTVAYDDMRTGLASPGFHGDKPWQAIVERARRFVDAEGFDIGEARVVDDLREALAKADMAGVGEAESMLQVAGHGATAGPARKAARKGMVTPEVAQRVAALKLLRHTYLLRRAGAHQVWCVATPHIFPDWPHEALKGDVSAATHKLTDPRERFTPEQRAHLANASQVALFWVQKAMIATGTPGNAATLERVPAGSPTKPARRPTSRR